MKKNVYPRLRAQMALRGYSVKSLSEASGIRYHTLSRKIRGEFDFTLREAAQLQ
ncbi:MAG: helix-turn-helix transcriptional regulator [Clostridiales bacterium]|nr:helix-turn-helix transcriptional regulator [Clostridiales bacterium]